MACSGLGDVSAAQINAAAAATGLPCSVVRAQINMESGGVNGLTSSAGAVGVAQFLPSTFSGLGCHGSPGNVADAMTCYATYMSQLLHEFGGNVSKALAAYNAGPGNIGAGAGYASAILAAAGQGSGLSASGGTGGGGSRGGGGGSSGGGPGAAFFGSGYTSDINPLAPATETTSFLGDVFSTVLDPFKEIVSAEKDLSSFFLNPFVGFLEVFKTLVTGFNALLGGVKTIIYDLLWLFQPTHWIRIFCFLFGLFTLIPATYALMHTGTGDMYLAMGIFLFTLTGILLFLAFHNLPYQGPLQPASACNVITFQALLAYVSESIRAGGKLDCSGVSLDAYTLGDTGPTGGISVAGKFSPDSTGGTGTATGGGTAAGSASGSSAFKAIANATGIFPTILPFVAPTPTGAPPVTDIYTGQP